MRLFEVFFIQKGEGLCGAEVLEGLDGCLLVDNAVFFILGIHGFIGKKESRDTRHESQVKRQESRDRSQDIFFSLFYGLSPCFMG